MHHEGQSLSCNIRKQAITTRYPSIDRYRDISTVVNLGSGPDCPFYISTFESGKCGPTPSLILPYGVISKTARSALLP
jgi:hypothetical protein